MKYLPWAIGLGVLTFMFCPHFKKGEEEEEEVSSGRESLAAVEKAIRRMS